jgi:HSP20 family molecular chaperone IbpA
MNREEVIVLVEMAGILGEEVELEPDGRTLLIRASAGRCRQTRADLLADGDNARRLPA